VISKNDTIADGQITKDAVIVSGKLSVTRKVSWGMGAIVDVYMINEKWVREMRAILEQKKQAV
jgi:hypothetical protein